jgi:hypothetical protein
LISGDRAPADTEVPAGAGWLATHPRATERGSWVVDPAHWDGLSVRTPADPNPLDALLASHHAAGVPVARRPLTDYQTAALGTTPGVDPQ